MGGFAPERREQRLVVVDRAAVVARQRDVDRAALDRAGDVRLLRAAVDAGCRPAVLVRGARERLVELGDVALPGAAERQPDRVGARPRHLDVELRRVARGAGAAGSSSSPPQAGEHGGGEQEGEQAGETSHTGTTPGTASRHTAAPALLP